MPTRTTTMNDQLTFDDLRAYQSGLLNGPALHRVERLILENPFYADALAGLEAMQKTASNLTTGSPLVSAGLDGQLVELRDTLHQRVHESANRKRLWPLWIATTTAAILFMLAMAIYFIFFGPKRSENPKPITPVKTAQFTPTSMPESALLVDYNHIV